MSKIRYSKKGHSQGEHFMEALLSNLENEKYREAAKEWRGAGQQIGRAIGLIAGIVWALKYDFYPFLFFSG